MDRELELEICGFLSPTAGRSAVTFPGPVIPDYSNKGCKHTGRKEGREKRV